MNNNFETVKGKFFWTEAGVELLILINQSISRSGGRNKMGYAITNKEAPEWFTLKEQAHFRKKYGKNLRQKISTDKSRVARFYSEEAIAKIKEMWPHFDIYVIAKHFGKSVTNIRAVAKKTMTEAEYANRFYNRIKAGEIYRAKYENNTFRK